MMRRLLVAAALLLFAAPLARAQQAPPPSANEMTAAPTEQPADSPPDKPQGAPPADATPEGPDGKADAPSEKQPAAAAKDAPPEIAQAVPSAEDCKLEAAEKGLNEALAAIKASAAYGKARGLYKRAERQIGDAKKSLHSGCAAYVRGGKRRKKGAP